MAELIKKVRKDHRIKDRVERGLDKASQDDDRRNKSGGFDTDHKETRGQGIKPVADQQGEECGRCQGNVEDSRGMLQRGIVLTQTLNARRALMSVAARKTKPRKWIMRVVVLSCT